jgi:site-specific recombinase XerD
MTAYGTGARRAEIAKLQMADIDQSRMRIHIRGGKGARDGEVPLSPVLYEELRQPYRRLARKPTLWLFPGGTCHTSEEFWQACRNAALRAGIDKPVHPHTIRHCFATHRYEAGTDLCTFRSYSAIATGRRRSSTSASPTGTGRACRTHSISAQFAKP